MRSQQILSRLIQRLRALPQPIISAVDGVAAGAGLALALASDVRVATRKSSFSAAFVRLGLTGARVVACVWEEGGGGRVGCGCVGGRAGCTGEAMHSRDPTACHVPGAFTNPPPLEKRGRNGHGLELLHAAHRRPGHRQRDVAHRSNHPRGTRVPGRWRAGTLRAASVSELPTRPWVLSVIAGVGGLCLRMPRPQGLLDWPPGTDGGNAAPSGPVQVGMVNELVDNPDQMRAAAEKLAKEMLECSHLVRAGHCCRGLARQWFLVWREGRAPAATCPWM